MKLPTADLANSSLIGSRDGAELASRDRPARTLRPAWIAAACVVLLLFGISHGQAETKGKAKPPITSDEDEDEEDGNDGKPEKASGPNFYLDLATTLTSTPGSTYLVGFESIYMVNARSSRNLTVDAPLTYEFNDHFSIHGGPTFLASQTVGSDWTALKPESWSIGFSADILEQKDWLPTITFTGSYSQPVDQPAPTVFLRTFSPGLDLDYSLDEEETLGLVAGASVSKTTVGNPVGNINPGYLLYAGAYGMLTDEWKLTGKAGVSVSGGAQALGFLKLKRTDLPVVQLSLEREDDNDNTLFGVSFTVAPTPEPSFQLSVTTPLYFVKN